MVQETGDLPIPLHLRNAPTSLMSDLGHGEDYRYAHDEHNAFAAGENYLPEALKESKFYHPVERGLELKIVEKLRYLDDLNKSSKNQRYSHFEEHDNVKSPPCSTANRQILMEGGC